MRQTKEKVKISFVSVYVNIAWKVSEEGIQETRSETYANLKTAEDLANCWREEGWCVQTQMGLFSMTEFEGKYRMGHKGRKEE